MLCATLRLGCCLMLNVIDGSAGILAVALAGLKYSGARKKDKAMNLVLLLRCLVSSRFLLGIDKAENIITLLRMQGLMRISGLLCPVLGPTAASADDMQEGVLPLVFSGSLCTDEDTQHATVVWNANHEVCHHSSLHTVCLETFGVTRPVHADCLSANLKMCLGTMSGCPFHD
jgi:hypothetical protein